MALTKSTQPDPKVPASKKYAVNVVTGVFFMTHVDMFHRPADGSAWRAPDNLEFFGDEKLARARQKEVLAEIKESRGEEPTDAEPDQPAEAPPAGEKDWTKIKIKADLAAHAKDKYGFELNSNRTFKNMQAQFLAGSTAVSMKMDANLAVRGIALVEEDQFPATTA